MLTWDDLFLSKSYMAGEEAVFQKIMERVHSGVSVYPAANDMNSYKSVKRAIYKAFEMTPFEKVRVVVLGQDPYHGPGQANGLAFSVPDGIALPPSLRNIFKELQSDLGGTLRVNGDLSDWARQGVLLLNSSLSVEQGCPNSMSDLWEPLTDEIIRFIDLNAAPVIFVLWGNNARSKRKLIVKNADYIVESAHPSPLSASRGFFGSKPFSKVNRMLSFNGFEPVIWN